MCAQFVKGKHDIGFLRQDGTTKVGLMLARQSDNSKDNFAQPKYTSYDDEYLSQQLATSGAGYSDLPPEKELALIRNDWRSGYGQEYDDNEKKYYYSIGADLRFKNMAILGPKSGSVTPASNHAIAVIVNGDCELETGWTGGSRAAVPYHEGDYSWYIKSATSITSSYQDLSFDAGWKGKIFHLRIWLYQGRANVATVSVNDGVDTTTTVAFATTGSWVKQEITHTLNANATRLRITIKQTAQADTAGYVNFDDVTCSVSGICAVKKNFNNELYFAIGNTLYKLNATGDALTYVYHFPTTITDLEVFGSYLFIALGYSRAYWYMSTAEACTESNLANNTMKYFCTLKAAADTLYGADTANTIRSTTNPLNGGSAWSTQTTVDSATNDICELLTRGNALYIRKEDRPFYLDTSGNVQVLVQDTNFLSASVEGKKSSTFLDDLFMPWGDQSLLHYDTGTDVPEWLDPSDFSTNLSEFIGKVQALANDERYLYAIVDNDTKVEVLAGREETVDGETDWRWHSIAELTMAGAQTAYVSDVFKKRLWISSTTTGDIQYIPLTTRYGDITSDTNYQFLTGGYFVTSWHHCEFKSDMKAFIKMTLTMADTTTNIYWTASYQKLGDTTWTTIGTFKTSPTTTAYIPVDGSANKPKSTMMRFKFTGTTNDVTKTPVLLGYDVRAILYPTNRRIIDCEVICSNKIPLINGEYECGQAATIKAAIEEARAATYPIAFYDVGWSGTADTVYVKVLPTTSTLTTKNKNEPLERHYRLVLQVVPIS